MALAGRLTDPQTAPGPRREGRDRLRAARRRERPRPARPPSLSREDIALAELGLKFAAGAHRRDTPLGMPSGAVDRLWQEFTLDTSACERFCRPVYGLRRRGRRRRLSARRYASTK
ncbi:MAG: hypothetical protein M3P50_13185 [Actinomycetota bacterium]|nr:hypothetical protein [Actinomycetota bacterium]